MTDHRKEAERWACRLPEAQSTGTPLPERDRTALASMHALLAIHDLLTEAGGCDECTTEPESVTVTLPRDVAEPVIIDWRAVAKRMRTEGGYGCTARLLDALADALDAANTPNPATGDDLSAPQPSEAPADSEAVREAHSGDSGASLIRAREAAAWDEGAKAAWERSTPEVNGLHYWWRSHGEPRNPYRQEADDARD